jgi:hypothetical protein
MNSILSMLQTIYSETLYLNSQNASYTVSCSETPDIFTNRSFLFENNNEIKLSSHPVTNE